MPELTEIEKLKTAGFVDRGYNHSRKQNEWKKKRLRLLV